MQAIFSILSLIIVLALYAAFFKLSARVVRASCVTWLYAFQLAGMIVVLSVVDA